MLITWQVKISLIKHVFIKFHWIHRLTISIWFAKYAVFIRRGINFE